MAESTINNKRIAKNTLFLYLRMLIVMAVSLYTVRAFLDLLGIVDYGIYNGVGSVVGMFAFINGTLATSSQRYFSIEIAKKDMGRLSKWFNLNLTVFGMFILAIFVIAETIGLWFLNNKMTIPDDRIFAANVVYQLSIISCALSVISVPYNALLISHERMGTFAFIGVFEAAYKLLMVLLLSYIPLDKLILYAVLFLALNIASTAMYMIYCHRHFKESHFSPYWNKREFFELMGFSGWHFFGTISVVVRSQGINILINMFFNPAVNAARAIAFQVNTAVGQFSSNFQLAVKPQLYKSYSQKDFNGLFLLMHRSTILSMYLQSLLIFPIFSNASFVLGIWLKDVPEYAVLFTQLVLINGLLESTNTAAIVPALATGRIKKFEIVIASIAIANLPISYVALRLGFDASATMFISIALTFVTVIWRAFILRELIGLPHIAYMIMITKLIFCSMLVGAIMMWLTNDATSSFGMFIIYSLLSVILTTISYFLFAINSIDRKLVLSTIVALFKKYTA